jgi:hypothetical protein
MTIKMLATATALAALMAAPALAQQGPPGGGRDPKARFEAADADKDGKLTKAEWTASIPEQFRANINVDERWTAMDADKNGTVSLEEMTNAPRPAGGPGGGRPPG